MIQRSHSRWRRWSTALAVTTVAAASIAPARADEPLRLAPNPHGIAATTSATGGIDRRNPFFQSLGSNGRSCASCHVEAEGWTVTPLGLQLRFLLTAGKDPVFRTVDGSNSPRADVSSFAARQKAYSMLLNRGVFRIGLPLPADAEFELAAVDDPYGFASAKELSLFRRPLPTTNLRFLNTVMWDGRDTLRDPTSTDCIAGTTTCFAALSKDLTLQSGEATLGHAQAMVAPTAQQSADILAFEMSLHTAQVWDLGAGRLDVYGARGGPLPLPTQASYFGINDTLAGDYRTHASFNPQAMSVYDGWSLYVPDARRPDAEGRDRDVAVARRQVARGEALFNQKPIAIAGVKGLNDLLRQSVVMGTCTTCHDAPNAGNHSVPLPLDIGLTDAARRTPDMPLYTLRNKATGELVQTTDPGRALVTGLWTDVGKFKGPTLRALATRAPYFHNGFARNLDEAVRFYDTRFGIGFTAQETEDLVAFLKAL